MTEQEDVYAPLATRGRAFAGKMLGEKWLRDADAQGGAFGSQISSVITSLVYGGVWARPGLSLRDRSLIVVAVHAALGRPHEMRTHVPAALRNGATLAEIEEVLIQVGAYAGFPTAANANIVIQELLSKGLQDDGSREEDASSTDAD